MIPNYSVLRRDPSVIGEAEDALYCVTDDVTCCGTPPSLPSSGGRSNEQGRWFFPSGDNIASSTDNANLWYASWLTGAVVLNFRGDSSRGVVGIYHCDIQDSTGTTHQLYACIYGDGDSTCKCIHAHTHARTHARAHARTHAYMHA